MSSHYNLDFITHLKERLDSLFDPHKLDWTSIHFENSIAALKPFNAGSVMKVIKTLFNAWTTSSRMGGAHYIYPCLFGCKDKCDRLGHCLVCPMMLSLRKFMHRELSIHPPERWGLNSPNKRDIIHMCCVFLPIMPLLLMSNRTMTLMGLLTKSEIVN